MESTMDKIYYELSEEQISIVDELLGSNASLDKAKCRAILVLLNTLKGKDEIEICELIQITPDFILAKLNIKKTMGGKRRYKRDLRVFINTLTK